MKSVLKSLLLLLITTVPVFWNVEDTPSIDSNQEDIESQITPESNQDKIKKLQVLFKELKLYSWNIDWEYKSIESSLINYQIKAWIVNNKEDWGAWYFWKKTINALKRDFKEEFEKSANAHLKMKEPRKWLRYFVVTAYYSPLPNQKRYTTWSYYWDKRLNWEWHTTASWKWVFPGLLAAPRNYKFWTKIYLDWIWIWSVEDRWWAIVNAWERWYSEDRIDIWMWYWDEWLERALKWWKRKIKWEIVLNSQEVSVEFETSPVYKYKDLRVKPTSELATVNKLQELFTELELYSWEIDWEYESIKPTLVKFQLDNKVIASKNDDAAWYFGAKTVAAIRQKYVKTIFKTKDRDVNLTSEYSLSFSQRYRLEKLKDNIDKYFEKKSDWDIWKKENYKKMLKAKLQKIIKKQKNSFKKSQLVYLMWII